MFCHNCGKKLEEGVGFCPYCGAKQGRTEKAGQTEKRSPAEEAGQEKEPEQTERRGQEKESGQTEKRGQEKESGQTEKRGQEKEQGRAQGAGQAENPQRRGGDVQVSSSKAGGKRLLAVGAAAVLIVVLLLWKLVFSGGYTLKPTDYVRVKLSGMNTEGIATLSFDTDRLLADIEAKKTLTGREKEVIEVLVGDAVKDFAVSKSSGLSNGDEIKVESNLEKKLLKDYGVTFKNDSMKVPVENLVEIQEISLNDYISFEFSGFDGKGYGSVRLDWDGLEEVVSQQVQKIETSEKANEFIVSELYNYLSSIVLDPYYMEELSNGDEVKTVISMGMPEIEKYGIRFSWEDASAVVEGLLPTETISLPEYLTCFYEGYDGAGRASVELDEEKLAADLKELLEKDNRGVYASYGEEDQWEEDIPGLVSSIRSRWYNDFSTTLDKTEKLANGDEIKMNCVSEAENVYLSDRGIYLTGGEGAFTADGLQQPQEIDLAKALTVEFSGVCPNVWVERKVDYDLPYIYDTSLANMDYGEWIQADNGDVYSGEITYDADAMLEDGYLVTNTHYEYTISGLNDYRLSCDSLDAENLQAVSAELEPQAKTAAMQSEDEILESAGGNWIVWKDCEERLEQAVIMSAAEENDMHNRMYLVYHLAVPVKMIDRTVMQKDTYYVVCGYDVEETPEGSLICDNWYDRFCTDEAQVEEYILDGAKDLGEGVQTVTLELGEDAEELSAALEGDAEISGEAVETVSAGESAEAGEAARTGESAEAGEAVENGKSKPGEIQGNAENLAAAVITYENHTYARFDINLSWELASQFCEKAGGHLAVVTSARENQVITQLLKDAPFGTYWLGATDEGWEGGWHWVNGEPFDWTNWDGGQPDNNSYNEEEGENYLETGSSFGYRWNDRYAGYTEGGFVLEVEPLSEVGEAGTAGSESGTAGSEAGGEDASDNESGRKDAAETYLTDLIPSSVYDSGLEKYVQDPFGNIHFYSLYLDASEDGMANYDLNGEWSEFSGNISTWTDAGSEARFEIAIWGDDQLLFSKYDYRKTDAPIPFSINVEGVERLTIQTANRGAYSNGYLFINEGKLRPSEHTEKPSVIKRTLSDIPMIDGTGYEDWKGVGMAVDSIGTAHRELYRFNGAENSRVLWNLDGAYDSLEGMLLAGNQNYDPQTAVSVEILADGERVFEAEHLEVYRGYVPVSVELTGKKTLEVHAWIDGEGWNNFVYLADTVLVRAADADATDTKTTDADATETKNTDAQVAADGPVFPEIPAVAVAQAAEVMNAGNYRYYRFDQPLTWKQAEGFCRAAGGRMACPTDARKNMAVQSLISNGLWREYWLGGQLTGDTWNWSDGSAFGTFQNWDGGQPDNYNEAEYLLSMRQNGSWNDCGAEERQGFVMEVPAVENLIPEDGVNAADLEWSDSARTDVVSIWEEGNAYFGTIQMDASENARFEIPVNGAYERFSGRIFSYDEASENVKLQFAVFGDGKKLYELQNFTKNRDKEEFSVDLTGVKVLTVATSNSGSYGNGYLFLAQAQLTEAGAKSNPMAARLTDLVSVDAVECVSSKNLYADAYGKLHDGYLAIKAGTDTGAVYNLDGRYTDFAGTITAGQDTKLGVVTEIAIYADGELVCEEKSFEKGSGSVSFAADLTGRKVLEIRVKTAENETGTWVYLTDDVLETA